MSIEVTVDSPAVDAEQRALPSAHGELRLATFCGIGPQGEFLVLEQGREAPAVALSGVALAMQDIGAPVVLAPARGPAGELIVLGRLQSSAVGSTTRLCIDADRLLLQADRELELRCGPASIVLTRAGKVLIRGEYVLTRSKGANRIKGAYVDIN